MREICDVAIIGAGTAGLAALREVRKHTDNFVIVNDGAYGTTCARVGCMPSKALIEASRTYHRRNAFDEFGIRGAEHLHVDVPAVLARVRRLRDEFVSSVLRATDDIGARNIPGRAVLVAPDRLEVNGRFIEARRIIIAAGSSPVVPKPWRALGDRLITTDELFEQRELPRRIAVVGLGYVGVEIAQALSRLGIDVTAVDAAETIAGLSDPDVIDTAAAALGAEFTVRRGIQAQLERTRQGVRVHGGEDDDPFDVTVDMVLAAVGRRPNLERLGLDALGVELDDKGMPPFDPNTMQIADLPLFIAGDVNAYRPLLHEAADEGHIAGRNAMASSPAHYQRRTPLSVVFTDPEIAVVGASFAELKDRDFVAADMNLERQGRARIAASSKGLLRLYADRPSGCLLGAELCATEAAHLGHLLALAIQQQMSVQELLRLPYYHPTIEEGLRSALRALAREIPGDINESDLARCDKFGIEALD
jgi:dihydrolipoamide dehydrogenase